MPSREKKTRKFWGRESSGTFQDILHAIFDNNNGHRIEKIASGSIGGLLLALSLGTEASAIAGLVLHQEPDVSNASLIISASALVLMIFIWLPKRYLARALNSSAMQGEATCSLSCIQITLVLFSGSLIFRLWRGGWWVDSATSLILGILFGWEGFKMIRWVSNPAFDGGCCDHEGKKPAVRDGSTAELGQQYRDLCECCLEKSECKESGECKCGGSDDASVNSVSSVILFWLTVSHHAIYNFV